MTDQTEEVAVPVDYLLRLTERLNQFEWQPIETAPKDGRDCLVTGFTWNDPKYGRWQQVCAWNGREWATEQAPMHPPTHWMPLPPSPVGSGSQHADATP